MGTRALLSVRSALLLSTAALLLACSGDNEDVADVEQSLVYEGSACRVEYVVSSSWSNGFAADVKVTNKQSTTVKNWKLSWDFPSGQKVTSLWNATYTQSGARVDVNAPSWGPDLTTGSSAAVGFNGSHTGTNTNPTRFYLNGVDCGSGTSGSGGSGGTTGGTAGTSGSGGTGGTTGGTGGTTGGTGGTSGSGGTTGGTGGTTSTCNYPQWQQGTNYRTGDIVVYQGALYIAEHDNPGYSPTVSTWYWDPYAGTCGTGGSGGTTGGSGGSGGTSSGFTSIISRTLFDQMFSHKNALYSYDALVSASQAFPKFASEGTSDQKKREVAAFFANIGHETTGGWASAPGGPYAWGLYYTEEVGCGSGACTQYCASSSTYPCVSGQTYHGRGPIQLSWNYNYGQAGTALGLNLLSNPNLVKTDGVVSFKTALWFWMTAQSPKPSAHAVMVGQWTPTSSDINAGRQPGFGMTVNIINGAIECGHGVDSRVQDRIGFYGSFTSQLGVSQGSYVDCYSMSPY